MADVAPSLIAGPRMDWVMRNLSPVKFAEQFEGKSPAIRRRRPGPSRKHFVRSFDRTLPAGKKLEKDRRRIASFPPWEPGGLPEGGARGAWSRGTGNGCREWFRSTVPDAPPTNGQVADAVLYGVKNARFLEDRFLGRHRTPVLFLASPPPPGAKKRPLLAEETFFVLSVGSRQQDDSAPASLAASLDPGGSTGHFPSGFPRREHGSGVENRASLLPVPGRSGWPEEGRARPSPGKWISRTPRILEPWLDNLLPSGGPFRPAGAVLFLGTTAAGRPCSPSRPDERGNSSSAPYDSPWASSPNLPGLSGRTDTSIVVLPPPSTEEGHVIRAAARQIVRTALAEQHFLILGKTGPVQPRFPACRPGGAEDVGSGVLGSSPVRHPPEIEPVPVGPAPRP